ncbi:MAG: ferrochelatase [Bacteroidota bacterium]|nr:ferrochelatase [Bacteroidota bacterium]
MKMRNIGLLILNLGSPESYETADVKTYLNEFLTDERVIDSPWLVRQLVVKGFIVPFRAPKSAEAYKTIWTKEGSPLKVITQDFKIAVQQLLNIPVAISMRYGSPTPAAALKELESQTERLDEILIAPMYPHYAMSSYETAVECVKNYLLSTGKNLKLRILKPFYSEPGYISSLAKSIKPFVENGEFDAALFSYHGLPIRHLKKSDPSHNHCYSSNACCELKSTAWEYCYKHQVKTTTKLVTEKLNLSAEKTIISFQSRLGSGWIEPFTDKILEELPAKGIKKLVVICPAFVADCLETLEEIHERGKETFLKAGGEKFVAVPCLNTQPQWIETFTSYCKDYNTAYAGLWSS